MVLGCTADMRGTELRILCGAKDREDWYAVWRVTWENGGLPADVGRAVPAAEQALEGREEPDGCLDREEGLGPAKKLEVVRRVRLHPLPHEAEQIAAWFCGLC